jgi:hypothetical protein
MTLTDIIAKITLFAKRAIVSDRIGIGITSPASKLHISDSGDTEARITSANNQSPTLSLDRTGGRSYKIQSDLGQLKILHGSPGIGNANALAMHLNPQTFLALFQMDVGIGGIPGSKLDVAGDISVSSATTSTTATAGAQTLPASPVGFLVVSINGTSRKIPYYAT